MHTFGSGLRVCFSKVPVTDPRQYFLIRILRLAEQTLVLQPVHLVSLVNIFIIEFSKPPSWIKTEELLGPVKLVKPSRNGPQTTQETVENFSVLSQLGHVWLFKAFTNTCTIPLYKTKEGSCRKIALLLIFFFIARTLRSSYKGTQKRWPDKIECILLGLGYSVYVLQWYSSLNSLQRSAMKKRRNHLIIR